MVVGQRMNKFNAFLLLCVLGSALYLVTVQDQARQKFIALERGQKAAKLLDEEYAQLLLEQTRLINHVTIEQGAQKQALHAPTVEEIRIIEKPRELNHND